ncbi:hypothetical protein [Coxiella burnetii]|uniref:hypothetical protein n=1 Tax=Coxiella burnetii TaxID=777 RepID=UPI0000183503|nr:hypothetical protein [Coxiella burnetii]ABX79141.1 hypothetical protein COXBURSA331_A0136 [Coxiella burnetii RSA 331]ARI64984.1 hypothetical protein B7L74_00310 [Coxiella burnetii]ARK26489.1 hypothetical protein BMW92_00305 [Coxiella burnetii]ATN67527.1 hypothetical protein AYM17_09615 [Coxiella burnetii]ATN73606.1 hypothetical protein AYM90_00285 [Coxiella burnetii]
MWSAISQASFYSPQTNKEIVLERPLALVFYDELKKCDELKRKTPFQSLTESVSEMLPLFYLASERALPPLDKEQEDQCQAYYEQQIAKPNSPLKKPLMSVMKPNFAVFWGPIYTCIFKT